MRKPRKSPEVLHAQSRRKGTPNIATLDREIRDLRKRIDELSVQPFTVLLSVLPEPYAVRRDLHVLIAPTGEDFVATLTDAGVSATGDTELDAISNLKDVIIQKLEILHSLPQSKLGRIPKQQLAALQALIHKGK